MATASNEYVAEHSRQTTTDVADRINLTPLPLPTHIGPISPPTPVITPLAERRGSRIVQGWTKRRVHRWRSPLCMVVFFLLGLAVSIAHCVFYPKLLGKLVGDSSQQEEKIRYRCVLRTFTTLPLTTIDSAPRSHFLPRSSSG
jgi:hypothetical protein